MFNDKHVVWISWLIQFRVYVLYTNQPIHGIKHPILIHQVLSADPIGHTLLPFTICLTLVRDVLKNVFVLDVFQWTNGEYEKMITLKLSITD